MIIKALNITSVNQTQAVEATAGVAESAVPVRKADLPVISKPDVVVTIDEPPPRERCRSRSPAHRVNPEPPEDHRCSISCRKAS